MILKVFLCIKKTFNITFHFKPVLKNEELASLLNWKLFWDKHGINYTFMYQICLLLMKEVNLSGISSKNIQILYKPSYILLRYLI